MIAFHSTLGGRHNMKDEYIYTTAKPPKPAEVVFIHRSLGVGKVTNFFFFSLPHLLQHPFILI
jgi:hypothetical protein